MKTKILTDFQICISVTLREISRRKAFVALVSLGLQHAVKLVDDIFYNWDSDCVSLLKFQEDNCGEILLKNIFLKNFQNKL